MNWTEIFLSLILINLLTQSKWKIIKIIRILITLRIIAYIHDHTQTLSNNTWTTFIQIWILIGGFFILKTIHTYNTTIITIRRRLIITSILLTTFKNWIILYITIELITITTLLLIRFNNKNAQRKEASIKYLILRAISSTILITGILITRYNQNRYTILLKTLLRRNNNLILTIILFKIGRAPFHIWITDIYEGTKTKNLPIIILIPKIAIIRTLLTFETNNNILLICGILSTAVGAIGAINQKKIKRLLAYRRINNTGIIIIGLHIYTLPRIQARIIHIIIYTTTLTILLITLQHTHMKNNLIREITQNDHNNNKNKTIISILLLSLSGLPPLPGFLRKWLIISSTIKQQLLLTSTWILITNIPRTAYYFYTIIFRYFKKMKNIYNTIQEQKIKHYYIIARLTHPTLRILIHPQLILIPRWIARTNILNVPFNNNNPPHKFYPNIHKSKTNTSKNPTNNNLHNYSICLNKQNRHTLRMYHKRHTLPNKNHQLNRNRTHEKKN